MEWECRGILLLVVEGCYRFGILAFVGESPLFVYWDWGWVFGGDSVWVGFWVWLGLGLDLMKCVWRLLGLDLDQVIIGVDMVL